MRIALYQPDIAGNVGTILRLAACMGVGVDLIEPMGYLEFIHLVKHAKGIVTDSGGITEEATVLGVPTFTMRDTTERPETVTEGTNTVVGTDPARIEAEAKRALAGEGKAGRTPALWDGKASDRIAEVLRGWKRSALDAR